MYCSSAPVDIITVLSVQCNTGVFRICEVLCRIQMLSISCCKISKALVACMDDPKLDAYFIYSHGVGFLQESFA